MTDERLAKWRYALGLLLAFLMGWQFAPQFAATRYRTITSILIFLVTLVLGLLGLRQLNQENKKSPKNRP